MIESGRSGSSRPWSRRRFIGAAAAVCVGCASDGADFTDAPILGGTGPAVIDRLVTVGTVEEVTAAVAADGVAYVPSASAWLVEYPAERIEVARERLDAALGPGLDLGLLALHQKCPHLGCRVPFCRSSGWFECPCHAARFNGVGEHQEGPSERGMDMFALSVADGIVAIDTRTIVQGVPTADGIVAMPPAGPHCVEDGDG